MKTYIKGNFRRSIFKSDKGYIIGLFKIRETNSEQLQEYINRTITFTGYFHELNEDDTYQFYGEELDHPRYGFQFQVTEYEKLKPEDKDGVIEFLSSDLFPGISTKIASKIVEVLGDNALDKIIEDPSVLNLVPRLTAKKAESIKNILIKYEESHNTIVYLSELGFSMRESLNIYNQYKQDTKTKIEQNIYELLNDIDDISFSKLDDISKKTGIELDDKRRIKAGIIHILKIVTFQNGDTYLNHNEILQNIEKILHISLNSDNLDEYLLSLEKEIKIVQDNNRYYLTEMWEAEARIADKVSLLSNLKIEEYKKMDIYLTGLEKDNNIIYNQKQKEAISKALENNIVIITGGPGTGKTTIIKAIVDLYGKINKFDYDGLVDRIALLAPTGRASKRISESTGLPAMTIHRYLKWNKETNEFAVNEYNKTNSHLIIIDEVSMIDINLLDNLFKGLTDNIKLVLVGDYNQLPSVGPGQVLKDLIDSDIIDTVHLDMLYRQDENSYINTLAMEIKNNDLSKNFLETKSDYTFLECTSVSIKNNLKNICKQIVEKGYDYKRVQVMAPMYMGENGIDNLNQELQTIFNPEDENKKEIEHNNIIFREKDKILQLVNMPDENIYNGDIGIIKNIILSSGRNSKIEIHVDFDGNVVKYTPKDFHKIKHGFIVSIHKSQGSEFEVVVIPVSNSYKRMLYRKLIYTGITRAKKKLILLGEPTAFKYAVANNDEYIRKTSLLEKITNILYNSPK